MKKIQPILICVTLLFYSCVNNSHKNKIQDSVKDGESSFSVTSKNFELTSKSGKDVSLNEMIKINIKSGDKIIFNTFYFTLDNKFKGALNFYSEDGKLMLNAPNSLSLMSMPPNGDGLSTYSAGDNFEISGTTLIKMNSINFVISDIQIK